MKKLDKETKEKADRIKATLETLDEWDRYSNIYFYGKASSKEEVRESVINYLFASKEVNTLLDFFGDVLVFDEEKVKAVFEEELEEEDLTWEDLLDGEELDSFVFNCLDVSIDRNDLIDLMDIQTTKEIITKYIKVIKIYDFYFFSFSYSPKDEYEEFDDSNIQDLSYRYGSGFVQFISSVHVDKEIDDKVGDSFDIADEIDLDNRDNPFIYIDGKVYEADNDITHAQLINKIFNGDIYDELDRLRDNNDFSELRKLVGNDKLPIAVGHVIGDKAFIEESSLFNCSIDEVVNALKKKFTKVYNYSYPYKITRLAKLTKLSLQKEV